MGAKTGSPALWIRHSEGCVTLSLSLEILQHRVPPQSSRLKVASIAPLVPITNSQREEEKQHPRCCEKPCNGIPPLVSREFLEGKREEGTHPLTTALVYTHTHIRMLSN